MADENPPPTTSAADAGEWRPSSSPVLIAISVMLGTFMEVLDTSVANVALPHIAGSLSATPEQATWVLTSYLISNAIVLPTTAWLSAVFGRKRVLLEPPVAAHRAQDILDAEVDTAAANWRDIEWSHGWANL